MKKPWKFIQSQTGKGALFLLITLFAAAIYWFKLSPVPVDEYKVGLGEITEEVMGTGTLDAKVKMVIGSNISGRIESVLSDQGDSVSANQLLVTLDDDQLQLQVKVALANLETAKAGVNRLREELKSSNVALSNTSKTYTRYSKLVSKKSISQEKFDKAEEELGIARTKQGAAKAAVVEAKNKVIEAEKMLELRKAQLDDSQIRAPFDGLITSRERDPGNIVIPGSAILSLVSTKVLWINAWVDETQLGKVEVGQPAKIIFRSEPEHIYSGSVARLAVEVDSETREFVVDIRVDKLPTNWAIGQRAEVYIEAAKKDKALFVPEKYIKWRNNVSGVFVNNKGAASWHPIKIGISGGRLVEITEGIQKGSNVLTPISSNIKLADQTRISVQ